MWWLCCSPCVMRGRTVETRSPPRGQAGNPLHRTNPPARPNGARSAKVSLNFPSLRCAALKSRMSYCRWERASKLYLWRIMPVPSPMLSKEAQSERSSPSCTHRRRSEEDGGKRIDDQQVGELSPSFSVHFLPLLELCEERGLKLFCGGTVSGSKPRGEVVLEAARLGILSDDWLQENIYRIPVLPDAERA